MMIRKFLNIFRSTDPSPAVTQNASSRPGQNELFDRTFRFVAVDVETANGNQHSICQIGLAMVTEDGEIETLSYFVDPKEKFESFNSNLHGIDKHVVAGAPDFSSVLQSLRPFLERHTLIQHSNFDKQAFNAASKNYGIPALRSNWLDSVRIARKAWPEFTGNGGHGLANLKQELALDFKHHDAEEDARAAACIVLLAEERTSLQFPELAAPARKGAAKFPVSIAVEGNHKGPLFGHVACFTGQLKLSRTEAATTAAGAGISVKAGISKKITLLIVGDQDLTLLAGHEKSTKHRRAEELIAEGCAIKIIGEGEFLDLVRT
ncbi:exonuclease domain-containing protein [Falsihalocynthiibacter sp. BN13B15]|uniref:exonuclease domain-containing protein n=1 Tax=Falsihalocynthiibacter sp. BN13B15 TaxID=3240871 RepID=UPI0035100E8B